MKFLRGFAWAVFVVAFGLLVVRLGADGLGSSDDCGPPEASLESVTAFVERGCYKSSEIPRGAWVADAQRRLSQRHADENPATMAHHFLEVRYSPAMAEWLRQNRNQELLRDGPIPEGATMVAEVYATAHAAEPMEILSMVRTSGSWLFGRYLPDAGGGEPAVSGGVAHASCRGCHTFAGKSMVYGNYASIEGRSRPASPAKAAPANNGVNDPAPVFQRGDQLSQPLASGDPAIQGFLDFYSQYTDQPVPLLSKDDIVPFPPQSLDQVHPGTPQSSTYPITCEADDCFITSDYCQGCHSSTTEGTTSDLPQMTYLDESGELYANWSMYGEWSVSIMGLASRDPVWQAQIETEVNANPGVNPAVIQDVCFSCHGMMGERQKKADLGANQYFDIYNFFSTLQPNDAGYVNPYPNQPGADPQFAQYGSQARDGVSCETCHITSPEGAAGQWNGTDYSVFYGPHDDTVPLREEPPGPPYRFTALFEIDHQEVLGPDARADLNTQPMVDETVGINQAYDQALDDTYLRSSLVCATCHVLTVPKIPTGYTAGGTIPPPGDLPYYTRPGTCPPETTTWAADGNPVTDPCVGLSYEQATYFEWLNSEFPSFGDETTCQGCHMPLINNPTDPNDPHNTIVAQFEDSTTTKKRFRRHRLLGINLFVHEMYQQFYDLLGVNAVDSTVPAAAEFVKHNLLNAEQSIVDHATSQSFGNDGGSTAPVEIQSLVSDGSTLTAQVQVQNNSGHKFPSGAGFRRGFLKFEVLDAGGGVLWVSGQPNRYGAICNGPCDATGSNVLDSEFTTDPSQVQPHYETITRQDQVQIYQIVEVDDLGIITSRTLSLFHGVKDNRILPDGWVPESQCVEGEQLLGLDLCTMAAITAPECDSDFLNCDALDNDPYYHDKDLTGKDLVSYEIPLADIPGTPASARVTMLYQTIPPGYLVARFDNGYDNGEYGDATKRVIYMTSHLNLDLGLKSSNTEGPTWDIVNDDWSMTLSLDEAGVVSGEPPVGSCTPSETVLCLDDETGDRRFRATLTYDTALGGGQSGNASATSLDSLGVTQGGIFHFFDKKNPELLVKVLDFCALNGHYWVFYAAGTNVGFELTVEDTVGGSSRVYTNPDQSHAEPRIDHQAFATCP
ncbi:MAG: hypothetical protein MI919_26840 [Holophagales bacterium]|nr:hypothetical protein [Holophagales bacterium]